MRSSTVVRVALTFVLGCSVGGERVDAGPEEIDSGLDAGTRDAGRDAGIVDAGVEHPCEAAFRDPSNAGCEFWAVHLDQQAGGIDVVTEPWGVVLSNTGEGAADVTIEINTAPPGQPVVTEVVEALSVSAGELRAVILPVRTLDCGAPNDYANPGTCLSSNAFRITSSLPIVVYQFNVYANSYSNDASLLLPTSALGWQYRVLGWRPANPVPRVVGPSLAIVERSYVTIVGTVPGTLVTVRPSWRIRGNPPIAATPAGGVIEVTLGPFDVLNLETDDGTASDDPTTIADLSGSSVVASAPVAVFSGVELAAAPAGVLSVPLPDGWSDGMCCADHLEEQLLPMESVGTRYVVPRSPVRSILGGFREPDILRFVGVAETATVTTTLPAPFDSFTLEPGEVRTTWTQDNVIVTSDVPVMVGQILVSYEWLSGPYLGDPSLTVFPAVEQNRREYLILTPGGWNQSWIVVSAEVGVPVDLDGAPPADCIVEPAGELDGTAYETRRCPVSPGVHELTAEHPFGIVLYGYGSAGSYALVGATSATRVYTPPI